METRSSPNIQTLHGYVIVAFSSRKGYYQISRFFQVSNVRYVYSDSRVKQRFQDTKHSQSALCIKGSRSSSISTAYSAQRAVGNGYAKLKSASSRRKYQKPIRRRLKLVSVPKKRGHRSN